MGEKCMQCYHNAERGGRGCGALLGWGSHLVRAPRAQLSHPSTVPLERALVVRVLKMGHSEGSTLLHGQHQDSL